MASAVREQNLSDVWTVEYALELLLIGGLVPEAVWLAHKLGDWKTSISVGVAFQLFCKHGSKFTRYVFLGTSKLDCKEVQPVHPKGGQFWVFIGRTDAEAETPVVWPPHVKS